MDFHQFHATKRCLFGSSKVLRTSSHAHQSGGVQQNGVMQMAEGQVKNVDSQPDLASKYFDQFPNYYQMVVDAKSRARRSILIDHHGSEHVDLSEFSNVEHVYSIDKETQRGPIKLSLVEFKSKSDADDVAKRAQCRKELLPVPLRIFRYTSRCGLNPSWQNLPFPVENVKISLNKGNSPNLTSYSEFVSNEMMSLAALRLRFLTLVNFEQVLCSGMFEEYELMPFGSSVIDIGCDSGDLDLIFTRRGDHNQLVAGLGQADAKQQQLSKKSSNIAHLSESLLTKNHPLDSIQRLMRLFGHILREYMPLVESDSVLTLPNAKVPIIKFNSRVTSIDCDLSFDLGSDQVESNLLTDGPAGIITSHILYSLCRNNDLFKAVVIYMRIFGRLSAITCKGPNGCMTNFQLLSLVMFYLQQTKVVGYDRLEQASDHNSQSEVESEKIDSLKPILPPFKDLMNSSSPDSSLNLNLTPDQLNQEVPEILLGLFRFYSEFRYDDHSLNLYESKVERKLDNSALFVRNPLNSTLNICRNVGGNDLRHFMRQIRLAREFLEAKESNCPLKLLATLLTGSKEVPKKINRPQKVVRVERRLRYGPRSGQIFSAWN